MTRELPSAGRWGLESTRTWFIVCGIAALSCPNSPTDGEAHAALLRRALDRLAHRGPDGEGTHPVAETVAETPEGTTLLGHRRLAIIDPAGGRQPLLAPDGAALVHNGMIYNDRALRGRLGGEPYSTRSDSESILHLVRRHGPDAVDALDGMFSFVYSDGERTVVARDPLGVKPLYRFSVDGVDAYASEVKAFDGVADSVEEFPPGHVYDSETGLRPYYQVPEPTSEYASVAEAVTEVRDALEAAVAKRMRSDVPLGCLLSGGLDSSLICALASRHTDELHTFAVGLAGSPDLAAARTVADHLGTVHHELVVTEDEVRAGVPDVLWHLESPDVDLVRSAVATWHVMRFAASHVKVVLSGEGADELFAGYRYHADYDDPQVLQAELRRSLGRMHNVNLQRVDRMSMAHGLEAREPFLDRDLIEVAMRVPAELKQADPATGRPCEKWVLRAVASDLLPESVLWRRKAQFDEGSGMAGLLPRLAGPRSGDARADRVREAAWYERVLAQQFAQPELVLGVAGTWASGRLAAAG
jgi:asparagine synthase (glutamine-hydrolysing)